MADIPLSLTDDSVKARFWAKVDVRGPDECWPWQGARGSVDKAGRAYGKAYCKERRKNRPAAQISWELHNGRAFPSGMNACHSCDNPSCVNPAHIWAGTQLENILDCMAKGRTTYVFKTHCVHGHELTGQNLKIAGRRARCRECQKRSAREWARQRRVEERSANALRKASS